MDNTKPTQGLDLVETAPTSKHLKALTCVDPVLCYHVMGRVMRDGVMAWWRGLRYGVMVLWVVGVWDFCVMALCVNRCAIEVSRHG